MTDISYSNVNDNTPVLVGNSQLTDKRGINGFNYLEILKEVSEEAENGIPEYWLKALKNTSQFGGMINFIFKN